LGFIEPPLSLTCSVASNWPNASFEQRQLLRVNGRDELRRRLDHIDIRQRRHRRFQLRWRRRDISSGTIDVEASRADTDFNGSNDTVNLSSGDALGFTG
jgi:hypothetical protein